MKLLKGKWVEVIAATVLILIGMTIVYAALFGATALWDSGNPYGQAFALLIVISMLLAIDYSLNKKI